MPIYHLQMTSLGRANGRNAVSSAAYRSGERLRGEGTQRNYDHRERQDVLHKEIMVPSRHAAADMSWAQDRSQLWNAAEATERRKNSRVAREYVVVLPAELAPERRIELARSFARELTERYQFAMDLAVHAPRDRPGSDPRNFHAHLLATTREVTPSGLGAKTTMEWSDEHRRANGLPPVARELLYVRERWATVTNEALREAGIAERVDHRSLAARGIDREPAFWLPRVAYEMERRGQTSLVGERMRREYQRRVEAREAARGSSAEAVHRPLDAQSESRLAAEAWLRQRTAELPRDGEEARRSAVAEWRAQRAVARPDPPMRGQVAGTSTSAARESASDRDHDIAL